MASALSPKDIVEKQITKIFNMKILIWSFRLRSTTVFRYIKFQLLSTNETKYRSLSEVETTINKKRAHRKVVLMSPLSQKDVTLNFIYCIYIQVSSQMQQVRHHRS